MDAETKGNLQRVVESAVLEPQILASGLPSKKKEEYHTYREIVTEMWELGNPKKFFLVEWRKMVAEFIGTAFLVFFGTGIAVALTTIEGMDSAADVGIGLGFGFAAAAAIYAVSKTSGGHINPAVTIGLFVAMKIPLFSAICYILSQIAGAILGSALVKGCFPDDLAAASIYGATVLNKNLKWSTGKESGIAAVSVGQGVLIEIVITFFLVFTVFATVKIPRDRRHLGRHAPLAIGLVILVSHILAARFTGPSMNPARSFGPAVISGVWTDHWVYWVGPIVGGVIAALIYKYFIIRPVPPKQRQLLDPQQEHYIAPA